LTLRSTLKAGSGAVQGVPMVPGGSSLSPPSGAFAIAASRAPTGIGSSGAASLASGAAASGWARSAQPLRLAQSAKAHTFPPNFIVRTILTGRLRVQDALAAR
jgi:hypothetical protein